MIEDLIKFCLEGNIEQVTIILKNNSELIDEYDTVIFGYLISSLEFRYKLFTGSM